MNEYVFPIKQANFPMSSGQIIATENTSFGPPKGSELEGNIPEHFREIQVGEILLHILPFGQIKWDPYFSEDQTSSKSIVILRDFLYYP